MAVESAKYWAFAARRLGNLRVTTSFRALSRPVVAEALPMHEHLLEHSLRGTSARRARRRPIWLVTLATLALAGGWRLTRAGSEHVDQVFRVSNAPLPVHEAADDIDYANTPVSSASLCTRHV